MTETIRYSLIGREDLAIGNGTFTVTLADGSIVTLSQVMIPEYLIDTGTANAYAVSANEQNPYQNGYTVFMKATNTNTTASTLNVNGLGAKPIRKNYSDALIASDIVANQIIGMVYDGTAGVFQVLNKADHVSPNLLNTNNTWNGTNAFASAVTISADSTVAANLAVTGAVTVTGDVTAADLVSSVDTTVGNDLAVAGDIALTGSMTSGTVPLARSLVTHVNGASGSVSFSGSGSTLVDLDCGNVTTGDYIFVNSEIPVLKAGTLGSTYFEILKASGTATIVNAIGTNTIIMAQYNQIASEASTFNVAGTFVVTGTGSLTLRLSGFSAGSNGSVNSGSPARLSAIVLKGT